MSLNKTQKKELFDLLAFDIVLERDLIGATILDTTDNKLFKIENASYMGQQISVKDISNNDIFLYVTEIKNQSSRNILLSYFIKPTSVYKIL